MAFITYVFTTSSVAEIAVPASTLGLPAVVPIVPSVCTKYCCPAVRPIWLSDTEPMMSIDAA